MPPDSATDGPTQRRSSRGAATAHRLREAARLVFADVGFATARVEDVVAVAGVSHGTFYTYYDNKAAVLDALVDDTAAALRAVAEAPWEGEDVAGAIEHVIGRFVDVFVAQAPVVRVWLEASSHEPHFRKRLEDVRGEYAERVAEHLGGVTRGTPHDAQVAAAALVAMVEGYATRRFDPSSPRGRDRDVRTLATMWVGALRALGNET